MEELKKRLFAALCNDMPEARAKTIFNTTCDALEYLNSRLGYNIDLHNGITEDESKYIFSLLERDDEYKKAFAGRRQHVKSGLFHLVMLRDINISTMKDEGAIGSKNVSPNLADKEQPNDGINKAVEIAFGSEVEYREFVQRIYDTLASYPDVGLIPEQILDIAQLEFYSTKAVVELLNNVGWCKKKGKRYYFVDTQIDEDNEFHIDRLASFIIDDSEIEIDEEARDLMKDPEKLLKYIQSKRNQRGV